MKSWPEKSPNIDNVLHLTLETAPSRRSNMWRRGADYPVHEAHTPTSNSDRIADGFFI